jgi:ribonuclease HI
MKRSRKLAGPSSARLFNETHSPHLPAPPASVYIANIDGASRGNPGPASYAVVLRDPSGKIVLELAKNIGRETNNVAEYYALLAALDYAATHDIHALRIRSDSELLVRQMQGRYKVKSPDLKPLHERAAKLARQLNYFVIEHVRRELNADADALANISLDQASQRRGIQVEAAKSDVRDLPGESHSLAAKAALELPRASLRTTRDSPWPLRIRARFLNGVLVPVEALDLPEGSEVTLEVRK